MPPPIVLQTTARLAREADPCEEGWDAALAAFGPVEKVGEDTPIGLDVIAETIGIKEALWCLKCVLPEQATDRDRFARLFAGRCAFMVLPIFERERPGDDRPHEAIRVARRFANGEATREEMLAAGAAAGAAAWDAQRKLFVAALRGEVEIDDFPGIDAPCPAAMATA